MKHLLIFLLSTLLLTMIVPALFAQSADLPFYFGVDLSYANEMDDCGAVYRENGEPRDPFGLFADHGATLVRARLWHNPDWTDYSTFDDVKRTFTRAQAAGMSTLLDFHYSDNWADPGRQEIPAAWEGFDTDELVTAVYDYTFDVLSQLHAENLTPDFVQIGNETNGGLLKESSAQNWARDARLFNAGIQAVRDFSVETSTSPQVMLHVAQPENTGWWFTQAEAAGIRDFDVIGISYYPQWSTFSIADMGAQVTYLRERFDKQVMVLETAYAWTRDAVDESAANILNQGIRGYPFSPDGQRRFMTDLTQSLISNGAIGVVYWEPAWVSTGCSTRWGQGSHWENATFFDFQNDNELLEGINFLNHDYLYPSIPVNGAIEADYGSPFIQDGLTDVLDGSAELDLENLYMRLDSDSVYIALSVAGDVFADRGGYLFYFDTTGDDQGADVDVSRRPITVADPYKPEFRLDAVITESGGIMGASYTLNAWMDGEWVAISFTGGAAISAGANSVIELQIPRALLGDPQSLNLAVISTGRGRVNTAADILGTDFTLAEWTDALVLDVFFSVDLS